MHLRLIAAVMGIFSLFSHASVVLPGDGPYSRWQGDRIQYIFDPHARDLIPQLSAYMQAIRKHYDMSFGWHLDENVDLILTSSRQQIPNAYATVIPNLKTVWYPSGPELLEKMAQSSWILALATHETAHLYQLDAKGVVNSHIKKVLGNALGAFAFVLPVVIHPNIFTPGFLKEGNAVLNESRANMGGRLHSGEVRALVLAQIQEGQIDPNRLINVQWRFPYNEMTYTQGAYFQAHLAAKHGLEKTNQFFVAQGDHYLWPLILNKTFREHFGASYPLEIREYTRGLSGLAKNQKGTSGRLVVQSEFISPLNHDDQRIFFLSTDGVEPAKLYSVNKTDLSTNNRSVDLPLAKVFFNEEKQPRVAFNLRHDLHHLEYSLYGEGEVFDPSFRGQIVTDQRAGKTVAVDAKNSWLDPQILLNNEPYDIAHSLPVLDPEGSVYYFRQNGAERILYKNRTPLFKFDGFYGKLTEVAADGTIYFIANTDYGSTLYQYRGQEISRVFASDRIVDARSIDGFRFVVVEVYADGHRSFIAEAQRSPAIPAVYSYGFTNYNLIPDRAVSEDQVKSDEREYNSFLDLRYSGTDFAGYWDFTNGAGIYLDAHFTDPLEYQYYSLGFTGTALGSQKIFASWTLTKYLPHFLVNYVYEKEKWRENDGASHFAYNQEIFVGLQLPLLRWRHWDAQWTLLPNYKDRGNREPRELTYGLYNRLDLIYLRRPEPDLGFYPWREFSISFQNKLDSMPGLFAKKSNTSLVGLKYLHGFPQQIYTTLSGNVGWAEGHDLNVEYVLQPLATDIRIPRLVPHDRYAVKSASNARLELAKVFNYSSYSTRIPLSIERLAPFAVAQATFFDSQGTEAGNYPANTFEWGIGVDAQVLLVHSIPAKFRILHAYDTRHPRVKDSETSLKLEARF